MLERLRKVTEVLKKALEFKGEEKAKLREEKVEEALKLLEELERDIMEKELKLALAVIDELKGERKLYYLLGKLYVEVSKEEAKELIKKELELFKGGEE
ncbi:MAG: hypothetical protein GXO03_00395 [Aquificae bacterium]|nr:hypothetical protein [Aquificota bacterium]